MQGLAAEGRGLELEGWGMCCGQGWGCRPHRASAGLGVGCVLGAKEGGEYGVIMGWRGRLTRVEVGLGLLEGQLKAAHQTFSCSTADARSWRAASV